MRNNELLLCLGFQGVKAVTHRNTVYSVSAEDLAQRQRSTKTWFTDETQYQGRRVRCVRAAESEEMQGCRRVTSRVAGDGSDLRD